MGGGVFRNPLHKAARVTMDSICALAGGLSSATHVPTPPWFEHAPVLRGRRNPGADGSWCTSKREASSLNSLYEGIACDFAGDFIGNLGQQFQCHVRVEITVHHFSEDRGCCAESVRLIHRGVLPIVVLGSVT